MPTKRRAVSDDQQQPATTLSLKERLAQKAKQKPDTPAAKSSREIVQLKGDIANVVDRMLAAIHAAKVMKGQESACRATVMPFVQNHVFMRWMELGAKPESPQFITPSGSKFILQCKDTLNGPRGFRVPKGKDGKPIKVEEHLKNNGVPADLIERLKDKAEFTQEESLSINMPKLEKEQPTLHSKLMELVLAANEGGVTDKDGNKIKFSDDDLEKLLERNTEVTLRDNFLARAAEHCKSTSKNSDDATKRLSILLTAIPPQWAVGSTMCADPEGVVIRLLKEDEGKGNKPSATEFKIGDKYTVKQAGSHLTVFRTNDGKELAKKECTDEDHAANTVRKWTKEPAQLTQYIVDNS